MNERKVLIILLVVVLIFVTQAALSTKKDVVVLRVYSGSEYTIGPNQVGVADWGWVNCSAEYLDDWTNASEVQLTLKKNGEIIQEFKTKHTSKYWGPFEYYGDYLSEYCFNPEDETWGVTWLYPHLKLNKPGDYELDFAAIINKTLTNGFDMHPQDGVLDVYEAGFTLQNTIIIHVLE
jgi:hypothetical protein